MKSHQRKIFVKFGWNPLTIFQVENLQRSNHKPYMEIVPAYQSITRQQHFRLIQIERSCRWQFQVDEIFNMFVNCYKRFLH